MGWWSWSSASKNEAPQQEPTPTPTPTQQSYTQPTQQRPPLTREEQADNELRDFLQSLESSTATASTSTSTSTQPEHNTSSSEIKVPKSIAPESLYPDTMSCRSAFDYAFFCQSFGGQWVNVYRYGELRSCSEHWENFWLCMKAQGFKGGDETKKEMIRDHYRKKAIKYKTGPSSEDVWEVRMEPLRGAFQGEWTADEEGMQGLKEEQVVVGK